MSTDASIVTKDIQELVATIISENGFTKSSKIKYHSGSQPGEGFVSKTYAVDIEDDEKTLHLFLKGPRGFKSTEMISLCAREVLFYKTIYPTYVQFMEDRSVNGGLSSIPKCYGTNEDSALLALENLRTIGFTLFNRTKYMNKKHLELVLSRFAQFHAVSFAMKDQQREIHDEFCEQCPYIYRLLHSAGAPVVKMFSNELDDFVANLDPVGDREIKDKYQGMGTRVEDVYVNLPDHLSEYSILTKGDCWIHNTMFLYEDKEEEHPKDLALIDWQCVCRASPVYDIAPLFYSGATKEDMDNYKYYLQFYHKELSDKIRELGSDPEILYPYSIFEEEWKDAGLYSICLAVMVIRVLLRKGEDVPDLETGMNEGTAENMWSKVDIDKDQWMSRAKCIAKHLIDIGSV